MGRSLHSRDGFFVFRPNLGRAQHLNWAAGAQRASPESPNPVTIQRHDPASVQQPPHRGARGIRETAPDVYEITSEAPSRGRFSRGWFHFKRFVLGPPLASGRERGERLTWLTALAILGADAIASSVYGPE